MSSIQNMEIVKFGRIKVKEGDCVSIKKNYFGGNFEREINDLGVAGRLIYGRVIKDIDVKINFTVKWDIQ